MASKESLDNLIEGLAGAVVEAQQRIETHQIKNFLNFFTEHKRPKTINIKVPSLDPEKKDVDGDVKDALYCVPLLPLVASSLLRIKEVEISFDTDLAGVTEQTEEHKNNDADEILEKENITLTSTLLKSIDLDLRGSGVFSKKTGSIHVVMKIEGRDISEGMARVVDRLIQTQGDIE